MAQRRNRNQWKTYFLLPGFLAFGFLAGCSNAPKSVDVSSNIRQSLDRVGLKDVSVSQDRDKGVVTLSGHVASDTDKSQAEGIARSIAGSQVVSNQVAVLPPGSERDAQKVNSYLDEAIEKNLHAAFIQEKLQDDVKYSVKNGVVTLSGKVQSQARRTDAEQVVAAIPNVQQVVNEIQVKHQKATASE